MEQSLKKKHWGSHINSIIDYPPPPKKNFFWQYILNDWEFLTEISQAYIVFMSMHNCYILFIYL